MTSFNKALEAETWKMSVIYGAVSTILAHNRNKDSAAVVNISSMLIIVTLLLLLRETKKIKLANLYRESFV